jgi:tetratricopeptide (TPR) repeat protein
VFALGFVYASFGQLDKSLQASLRAVALDPDNAGAYGNTAELYLALARLDEAADIIAKARQRKLSGPYIAQMAYNLAFLRRDATGMRRELDSAAGQAGAGTLLSVQSDTDGYFGRLRKAREFSRRAEDVAQRSRFGEVAGFWQANAALREAELGNADEAKQGAARALTTSQGWDVQVFTALAFARAGDSARAQAIVDRVAKENSQNTVLNMYWLPAIRASIELDRGHANRAIEIVSAVSPYDLAIVLPVQIGTMYPTFVRGESHLAAGQGTEAAAEFQKILDHAGIVVNFPTGPLAHLGLARAYALQGDTAKSNAAYQDFFALWKDADPDIPILKQAKAEYAKLQ